MYSLLIFIPLLSSLLCGFSGRFIGVKGSQILSVLLISLSVMISLNIFFEVGLNLGPTYVKILPWLESGMLNISWSLLFDSLTIIMLLVVTSISALVHLYSVSYMSDDPHISRFMAYLSLFTFFMLLLVTSDNYIQLFVGWEGVGVCSYLLINFWYTRIQASKAALKAMVVNRMGDFGYIIAIFAIYLTFRSLDFETVFSLVSLVSGDSFSFLGWNINKVTFICLLLFLGAVGKSAQIGLHVWLPDAMEGPTPVSALIHAATMVTAGVFLILRSSPLFEASSSVLVLMCVIGGMTAFFAATTGLLQNDLKKVIAYSTCSQLGYMVFACGVSNYSVSLFHLMNHAFFKALLFLSAGAVIHAISDEQDMRRLGGLMRMIPLTYVMIITGSLSLMGFPFLTGYYSKDLILELAYSNYNLYASFAYWLGIISAFFTAFYSLRLIALTFLNSTKNSKRGVQRVHESPMCMLTSLIALTFGSVFIGYLFRDIIMGLGSTFWSNSLSFGFYDSEFLSPLEKFVPVILSLIGLFLGIGIYKYSFNIIYKGIYAFLSKKWYFDKIYNDFILQGLLRMGYIVTFKKIDRGILELIGPYGLWLLIRRLSQLTSNIQTGLIYNYAFLMIIGLIIYVSLVWLFMMRIGVMAAL